MENEYAASTIRLICITIASRQLKQSDDGKMVNLTPAEIVEAAAQFSKFVNAKEDNDGHQNL